MAKVATTKESTKALLLEAGTAIMLEKGYNHTGIQEVLQKTDVPKGSFYYYFDSKEDFGLQIINSFADCFDRKLHDYLQDKTLTPRQRLRKYCQDGIDAFESQKCRKGCLIGNLSQEMADQSDVFRLRLEEVFTCWRQQFADCIKQAQQAGEIPKQLDANDAAEFFLSGWEGAMMRAKVTKTVAPMKSFMKIVFDNLFTK
jgi:TetR/AcrR family transcriptional repressor of nem operon